VQDDQRTTLSEFLRHIADSLDIPESHYKRAEERYQAIGRWLGREESIIAGVASEIYPQGSFRLGTVVKSITDAEEYDIDLVCELSLTKGQISQKQLKDRIGYEIKSYVRANSMKSPAEESRRCWRLNYADEAQFHMDILPGIPDGDSFMILLESKGLSNDWADSAIAITDNTLPNYDRLDDDWPRSNPKGYAAWFNACMEKQFDAQRVYLAESIKAKVEDVPDFRVKTPLQRAVQILKRHRDIVFVDDQEDKPISIIITTLAAHAYNNESDLLEALANIVDNMPHYIQRREGVAWVPNPVDPLENFADKWQEYPRREKNFAKWLQQVRDDLDAALQAEDIKAVSESLESRFGKRAINEALKHFPTVDEPKIVTLTPSSSRTPSRFDVPHRQLPRWPVSEQGWVKITGLANRKGYRQKTIRNESTWDKGWSLVFEAKTDIRTPYEVYWQVVNTGREAEAAEDLRGGFYECSTGQGGYIRRERTRYKGVHWVECFIVKDGICVASSGEFVINIE
jgi:hypothetical protein